MFIQETAYLFMARTHTIQYLDNVHNIPDFLLAVQSVDHSQYNTCVGQYNRMKYESTSFIMPVYLPAVSTGSNIPGNCTSVHRDCYKSLQT